MSPETKEQALKKLAMINVKIGYPSKWRDYSALHIEEGDLVANVLRGALFDWNQELGNIGQEVDKEEWGINPQTVNAYYNPSLNEIVFPAAILQPPFFNPLADAAVNYGGIGAVIGHEMTHGFDDQGRKSDGSGVLRDWWTPEDAAEFDKRAEILGAQYAALNLPDFPGVHINPVLTMGENIADLGGVILALDAYKLSLRGKTPETLDGFSGNQRLFLGWAQVWRALVRPETQLQLLLKDPHSPPKVRAFASLPNCDEWYEAFGAQGGDALFISPENRVRIW
jgi:putative endopeptidase